MGRSEGNAVVTEVALRELVKVTGGGTPRRSIDQFYGGGIPWVTPKDMKRNLIGESEVTLTEEGIRNSPAKLVPERSVLAVVRSGILKHTFPVALTTRPVAVNQDIKALTPRPELAPAYLLWLLKALQPTVLSWVRATTADNFPIDNLLDHRVELPPLREQRRIAAILDHVDALRAKRRQVLAHVDALSQSIFMDMFGDPVNNSRQLPLRKLADLGQLDRGVSRHRPRNDPALLGGPYPLIQTGDVANSGGYIRRFSSTYSSLGLSQSRAWPAGTLCITIAANIAKTGILTFDACFPDSVVGFTSDQDTVTFVRIWLSFLQRTLEESAPQSAQKNINLAVLRGLDVPTPGRPSLAEFRRRIEQVRAATDCQHRAEALEESLFVGLQFLAFRGEL